MQYYQDKSSWGYSAAATRHNMQEVDDDDSSLDWVLRLASGSAVVIFSISTCCMCHAVKRLFSGMGVNATVYELDQHPRGNQIKSELMRLLGNSPPVPVVFIGGKLIGPMDRVMASHINGTLVPMLKNAGALWL